MPGGKTNTKPKRKVSEDERILYGIFGMDKIPDPPDTVMTPRGTRRRKPRSERKSGKQAFQDATYSVMGGPPKFDY